MGDYFRSTEPVPAFRAGTQSPQVMPVVDSVIMSVVPDDGERIRAHRLDL
jgi:hypothetical protein